MSDDYIFPNRYGVALEESGWASNKWTALEKEMVREAIRRCAWEYIRFTTDQVWAELPKDFLVTKGMTAMLNALARLEVIENTGIKTFARRGGIHDHAQTLNIWRSLNPGPQAFDPLADLAA